MPWTDTDRAEVKERKDSTKAVLEERHAGFDKAAQDITPKYHRPSFSVVGEGSKSANTAYLDGYARIDWSK
jgi:hypothetical protein